MTLYIRCIKKDGTMVKYKATKPEKRYALLTEDKKGWKHLGDSPHKTYYTGMIMGLQNELQNAVVQLANGKIVELQYSSRQDMEFVIKESTGETQ
jgi:hypothetical protein